MPRYEEDAQSRVMGRNDYMNVEKTELNKSRMRKRRQFKAPPLGSDHVFIIYGKFADAILAGGLCLRARRLFRNLDHIL